MNRETLIISDKTDAQRLSAAFPGASCVDGSEATRAVAGGSPALVWLSTAVANWRDLLGVLIARNPSAPVVVVSLTPTSTEGLASLELGARGYCHAYSSPEMLREVALVVQHGGVWMGPELLGRMIGSVRRTLPAGEAVGDVLAGLSPREADVARAVADGCTNKEVALRLGITERTVKAHLSAVFEKLGVRDRLQLALRIQG
jgi:DNA-binding NarL/FixJ family response regulator